MDTKKYTFHVKGMHCASCVMFIEETLKDEGGADMAKADLRTGVLEVEGRWDISSPNEVAKTLTSFIEKNGYTLSTDKNREGKKWNEFIYAFPVAVGVIALFALFQKTGFMNLISSGEIHYGTVFVIGLVASVSTCLAVVGGLALSLSANYAKTKRGWKPQVLFHGGRIIGFFILGGAIGLLGGSLQVGPAGNIILGFLVAFVMLVLGINLLDVFPKMRKFQITMPKIFGKNIMKKRAGGNLVIPFAIGAATFFLPCGFTQSMQLYALSTGSFFRGALIMLVFSLGTLPVLAAFSFGSINITGKKWSGIFFKSAGIVVIALALFNIINMLVVAGLINPVFDF